eukprot:scaffold77424_cov55-Phaeocystis_antarctica.AAC.1
MAHISSAGSARRREEAAQGGDRRVEAGRGLHARTDPLGKAAADVGLGVTAVEQQHRRVVAFVADRAAYRLVDGLHAQVGVVLSAGTHALGALDVGHPLLQREVGGVG